MSNSESKTTILTVKEVRNISDSFVYWDYENTPRIGYRWMNYGNIQNNIAMAIPTYAEALHERTN